MSPATNMTDEWIQKNLARFPCAPIIKDGVETGDFRTCICRLSFPHLLTPSKPTKDKPEGGYGAVLLFPAGADLSVLKQEMGRVALAEWPQAGKPGGPKMFNPIRDQDLDGDGDPGVSEKYEGYVPGSMRIGANANRKIPVYDQNITPIVDEDKIYPGVWAICSVRCYAFGKAKDAKKRGPTFGLQSVMIVADDQNIGGTGSSDPNVAFSGVKIESNLNPSALFGAQPDEAKAAADLFS